MTRARLRRYFRHGFFPQLVAFEACVRHGSVTRAAEELSLAQPTVSCLVRKLSETVGAPVLESRARRMEPTAVGQELLAPVRGALRVPSTGFDERRAGAPLEESARDRAVTHAAGVRVTLDAAAAGGIIAAMTPHPEPAMPLVLPAKKVLTLEAAKLMAAAAEATAAKNGWRVVIAVVDDGGHALLVQRIDGTQSSSVPTAMGKARSAVAYKRPTRILEEMINQGRYSFLSAGGDPVALQGGLPIEIDGQLLGGNRGFGGQGERRRDRRPGRARRPARRPWAERDGLARRGSPGRIAGWIPTPSAFAPSMPPSGKAGSPSRPTSRP